MNSNKFLRFILCLMTALSMTGCVTTRVMPPDYYYKPSASTPTASLATIVGEDTFLFPMDNKTLYIAEVDGKPVESARNSGSKAISIEPGRRKISLRIVLGTYIGRASFDLDVQAGQNYNAKYEWKDKINALLAYAGGNHDIWIENVSDGNVVTERTTVAMGIENYRSPTYIPIYIPKR